MNKTQAVIANVYTMHNFKQASHLSAKICRIYIPKSHLCWFKSSVEGLRIESKTGDQFWGAT